MKHANLQEKIERFLISPRARSWWWKGRALVDISQNSAPFTHGFYDLFATDAEFRYVGKRLPYLILTLEDRVGNKVLKYFHMTSAEGFAEIIHALHIMGRETMSHKDFVDIPIWIKEKRPSVYVRIDETDVEKRVHILPPVGRVYAPFEQAIPPKYDLRQLDLPLMFKTQYKLPKPLEEKKELAEGEMEIGPGDRVVIELLGTGGKAKITKQATILREFAEEGFFEVRTEDGDRIQIKGDDILEKV